MRIIAAILLFTATTAAAQVSDGDALYDRRAEGHQGARASGENINAAIAAYERAIAQNPGDLLARARLLRALRFKGAYVARNNEEKKQVYATGKRVSGEAMKVVAAAVKPLTIEKSAEKDLARASAKVPHASEIFYWDSVVWGEWALAYGKMAALREGAADRIRRSATITMLMDSKLEGGGGARVLGRLHNQTPRVPFVTGWASDQQAVKFLRQSVAEDPTNKVTKVFLAEAIFAADKSKKAEAVKILREVISTPNDPDYVVENIAAQDDARALLKQWGV
jgi:tetratricopeptide (TPR) repeat protein